MKFSAILSWFLVAIFSITLSFPALLEANQANTTEGAKYSTEQLKQFVVASTGLLQVQRSLEPQLAKADTEEKQQKAVELLNQQAGRALMNAGITPDTFKTMSEDIQQSEALQQKVAAAAEELIAEVKAAEGEQVS